MTERGLKIFMVSEISQKVLREFKGLTLGPGGPYCVANSRRTAIYYVGDLRGCEDYLEIGGTEE